MAPPLKNSIITRNLTLTVTRTLTLYDQNHSINMLIIKHTHSIDIWVGVPQGTLTYAYIVSMTCVRLVVFYILLTQCFNVIKAKLKYGTNSNNRQKENESEGRRLYFKRMIFHCLMVHTLPSATKQTDTILI